MRIWAAMVGVLVALGAAGPAAAADEHVAVRVVPRETVVKPGSTAVVAFEMKHQPGLHSWPAEVPLPPEVESTAQRTSLDVGEVPGVTLVGIQWPQPHDGKVPNPDKGGTVTTPLYMNTAVGFVTLRIGPEAMGEVTVPITLHYQACNDKGVCYLPEDPEFKVVLSISTKAPSAAPADAQLFEGYKPELARAVPVAAATGTSSAPTVVAATNAPAPQPTIFGIGFGGGLVILFLAAAVGGFVLNLTPCVLPVIPIKIMTLVHHAGSPGKRIALGLWMAFGVVTFWFVIGLPMVFLRGAIDPSQIIFGNWWVTLGIGLLIAAMGLGIMGLFLFQLPQSVYLVNPKADTAWGSFLFGIMTAVLGLPCFGFVAGGLLAGAATLPRLSIATIFLGLGVGMASPYLLLSIWPGLINRIPRTGPASELVKQVMGLLLIAAAAWFVAAGLGGLLADMPYIRASLPIWIVAFFVLLAGGWLAIRTLQIARSAAARVILPALAVLAVGGTIALAAVSLRSDREDWMRAQAGATSDDSIVPGTWLSYNEARFAKAVASGKVVVIDFTADWCINCKVVKRTILDRDPVHARFQLGDVILLEGDCTSKRSEASAKLKALEQTGVPALAVYGPALDSTKPPLIYNSYLPETVISAIETAKGTGTPKVRVAEAPPASPAASH